MSPGLEIQQQGDFSKGMYRNPSPELIPPNGFADIINGLLEEDGSAFRRGGSTFKSNTWTSGTLNFMWDGWVAAGPRTLFASSLNFGTLAADDATIVQLAAAGPQIGARAASGMGLVFVPLGSAGSAISMWGGSRKTAIYLTAGITSTLLSRTVTGAATTFTTSVDPGMLLFSGPGYPTPTTYIGAVASIESDTSLTLHTFAAAAVTAADSAFYPSYSVPYGVTIPTGEPYFVGTAGDPARVLVGYRNQVKFSASGNPTSFAGTDYHQVPEGQIVGLAGLQDQVFVFTTAGVYVISNMNYNLIDAFGNVQQRLTQLTKDIICLDARGIASYRNALIVPATDDIWLIGPAQAPVAISDPIRSLYRSYVQQGCVTGSAAVFRNHYVLPILDTPSNAWRDTLVYRLDQQGWTRWQGHGAKSAAFATRSTSPTRRPALLAVSGPSGNGRIMDLTQAWAPVSAVKNDADATTHQFSLTTRDYPTGRAANRNLVKKVRVRYEMVDAAADHPVLTAFFGVGSSTASAQWGSGTWGSFVWGDVDNPGFIPLQGSANGGDAPPDSGVRPFPWLVGQQAPSFFRIKLVCNSPVAKLAIREIDSFIRSRSRQ